MGQELNVLLGQRMLSNGKLRVHWQVDKEGYPLQPKSSVHINSHLQLVPVEEEWLTGKRQRFEGFTIPYYDYIYMKDMKVMDEVYMVQPFEHDLVVLDLTINSEKLREAFTVKGTTNQDSVVLFNQENTGSIVEDFVVVAGFDKEKGQSYTEQRVREVDMAIGFKEIWKEDMGRIAEAYTYATMVNQNSIDTAKLEGRTEIWE